MKTIFHKYPILLFLSLAFAGCDTSDTKFFEDPRNKGLSIFSDKANNVASAYFNDQSWRTRDRTYNLLSPPTRYEVHVQKLITTTASDTLLIEWRGNINGQDNFLPISLTFHMAVPKSFNASDFITLQGQRYFADGIKSYFTVDGAPSLPTGKGAGTIYFHMAALQTNSPSQNNGRLAGLFETTIGDLRITKGRFDHSLEPSNARF